MGVLLSRNFPGAILVGILFGTFTCWIDGAVTKFDALNPTAHPAHFCYPMGAMDNLGNRVYNGAAYGTTESPVGGGCTSASYIVFPKKFAQKAACPNTCGALSFDNMQSSAFGGALLTFLYTDILDNTVRHRNGASACRDADSSGVHALLTLCSFPARRVLCRRRSSPWLRLVAFWTPRRCRQVGGGARACSAACVVCAHGASV